MSHFENWDVAPTCQRELNDASRLAESDDEADSCCPKQKPKPSCRPKKTACRPKKPACRPKKRACRPTKPACRPKPKCPKRKKCSKPGPITPNGYLNFVRVYRKTHCGLKPQELLIKAARAWCRLKPDKKMHFRRMACKVTKSCRHKNRSYCKM